MWSDYDPLITFRGYFGSGKQFVDFFLLHLLFLTQENAKIMITELLMAIPCNLQCFPVISCNLKYFVVTFGVKQKHLKSIPQSIQSYGPM